MHARLDLEALEDRSLLSGGLVQTNLVSDLPGVARFTDANLVNPWGIASGPTDPFWLANNGAGLSTIDDGSGGPLLPGGDPAVLMPIPAAHRSAQAREPTGVVFNGTSGFVVSGEGGAGPSQFIFASEGGIISGWSPAADLDRALVAVDHSASGAVYTGLALATDPQGEAFLYAANFRAGTVEVFDQDFHPVQRPRTFRDPEMPAGFAPFGIAEVGGRLVVTYARQDLAGYDPVIGRGSGLVDEFDTDGNLVEHFAITAALNAPWGVALAPGNFGSFANDLLVGNFGDGRISAFDPRTGAFLGQLTDRLGAPVAVPGLWGLQFGNGIGAGDPETLYFTAGIVGQHHGLFGSLRDAGDETPVRRGTFDDDSETYPLPPPNGPPLRATLQARPPDVPLLLPLEGPADSATPTSLTLAVGGEAPVVSPATVPGASALPLTARDSVAASAVAAIRSAEVRADRHTQALDLLLEVTARSALADSGVTSTSEPDAAADRLLVTATPSSFSPGADHASATHAEDGAAGEMTQRPAVVRSTAGERGSGHGRPALLARWLRPYAVAVFLVSGGGLVLSHRRTVKPPVCPEFESLS